MMINNNTFSRVNREQRRCEVSLKQHFTGTDDQWEIVHRLLRQPRYEQKSALWHTMRSRGITSSDIAAALGMSPFESIHHLIEKKSGKNPPPFLGNKNTEHGIFYEDCALALYEKETGVYTHDFGLLMDHRLFASGLCPLSSDSATDYKEQYVEQLHAIPSIGDGVLCIRGSPDGVAWCPRRRKWILVEIKCPMSVNRFYENCVPEYYMPQLQMNMYLTGTRCADFIQFIPSTNDLEPMRLNITTVDYDEVWVNAALGHLKSLWAYICARRDGIATCHNMCHLTASLPSWKYADQVVKTTSKKISSPLREEQHVEVYKRHHRSLSPTTTPVVSPIGTTQ
jgi:putative phage-type endonuclease